MASSEIHSVQTVSGNQPRMRRIPEASAQTWLPGTPLALNASGFVIPWAGSVLTSGVGAIIGTSKEGSANLTTSGVAQQQSFGAVPNQSAALNISRPYFNDGRTGIEMADPDTVFSGQVGPAQTVTQANVGVQYGLTKDSDNHWYVDTAKTTIGTNTCVIVTKLDPNDQSATPRGVYFRFVAGNVQPVV